MPLFKGLEISVILLLHTGTNKQVKHLKLSWNSEFCFGKAEMFWRIPGGTAPVFTIWNGPYNLPVLSTLGLLQPAEAQVNYQPITCPHVCVTYRNNAIHRTCIFLYSGKRPLQQNGERKQSWFALLPLTVLLSLWHGNKIKVLCNITSIQTKKKKIKPLLCGT